MVTAKCPPPLFAPSCPACRRLSSRTSIFSGVKAARKRFSISVARSISGQDLAERFDTDTGVYASRDIGVGIGPGLRVLERIELGDDQAAGEPGGAGIVAVHGRVGAGEQQTTFVLKLLQARQMRGAHGQPALEAVIGIG